MTDPEPADLPVNPYTNPFIDAEIRMTRMNEAAWLICTIIARLPDRDARVTVLNQVNRVMQ